jgi:drug/metabolite transporter (DMT)-like permease
MLPIPVLYAIVVLIWGSTWYAIKLQLGPVAEELSVAYRFGLAGLCLVMFAVFSGRSMHIARAHYPLVVLQGCLMFSVAYVLVYLGSGYITTGLVAVLYSLIVIFNGIFEWLIYRTPFDRRLLLASIVGLAGTAAVFWPEVARISLSDSVVKGIAWTVGSIVVAALGNMAAIRNTGRGIPVLLINAHGMLWGAGLSFLTALLLGRPLRFSLDPQYVGSLVYLAVLGSSLVFGCYMALLQRVGAARASYASVLFPIVALLISTVFEDYGWSPAAIIGVILILAGNWLALSRIPARLPPRQQQKEQAQG